MYTDGQGFATGLKPHLAVAGPEGADFYTLYLLPADAEVLRVRRPGYPTTCQSARHRSKPVMRRERVIGSLLRREHDRNSPCSRLQMIQLANISHQSQSHVSAQYHSARGDYAVCLTDEVPRSAYRRGSAVERFPSAGYRRVRPDSWHELLATLASPSASGRRRITQAHLLDYRSPNAFAGLGAESPNRPPGRTGLPDTIVLDECASLRRGSLATRRIPVPQCVPLRLSLIHLTIIQSGRG